MCQHGSYVILPTPEWLWSERAVPENGIIIDSCIAGEISQLWARGVRTLGSCCGHGTARPSLVLTNDREMPALARAVIFELDPSRDWELLQWQLADVTLVTEDCGLVNERVSPGPDAE